MTLHGSPFIEDPVVMVLCMSTSRVVVLPDLLAFPTCDVIHGSSQTQNSFIRNLPTTVVTPPLPGRYFRDATVTLQIQDYRYRYLVATSEPLPLVSNSGIRYLAATVTLEIQGYRCR